MKRCRRNLRRLEIDEHKLHLSAVQGNYRKAQSSQEGEYIRAAKLQSTVEVLVPRAEDVLQRARAKKFPGKSDETLPETTRHARGFRPPTMSGRPLPPPPPLPTIPGTPGSGLGSAGPGR